MKNTLEAPSSERGAVLVHVALALIALMSFATFAIDFGVLWTARRQAQNAADGAALAGAIALGLDNSTDFSNSGPAKTSAFQVLMSHPVWGQQPIVNITNDITFPPCPDDGTTTCVRVDVYRDTAHANALPMIFGQLVGLNSQNVRAMAMAKVAAANGSDCLKPWGLADKWDERNPIPKPWQYTDTFDPTMPGGTSGPDVYTPQNGVNNPGTGFTLQNDYGTMVQLKVGRPNDTINPGWFQPLDLGGGGGALYRSNISGCVGVVYKVGDDLPKENGNMIGPTSQGVGDLAELDPYAVWDPTLNGGKGGVRGSCVETNTCVDRNNQPIQYAGSPRVVAIPVFDLGLYLSTGGTTGNGTVRMVNILGFFVDHMAGNDVMGYLMSKPALLVAGGGSIAPSAAFVKVMTLIR
jgi:hypothetical protein